MRDLLMLLIETVQHRSMMRSNHAAMKKKPSRHCEAGCVHALGLELNILVAGLLHALHLGVQVLFDRAGSGRP